MQAILSRPHEDADGRSCLGVGRGVLVKRVRVVNPKQRWDAGRPDVEDPGVRYLTVDLHHRLELFVSYDAFIYVHGWQDHRHLGSPSFIVVGGRK